MISFDQPKYIKYGRVYDPVLGRFISPDPVYESLGSTQSFNKYSYVLNNPMRYTDPSGYSVQKGLYKPDDWNKTGFGGWSWDIITRIPTWKPSGSHGYYWAGGDIYIDRATGETVYWQTAVNGNYSSFGGELSYAEVAETLPEYSEDVDVNGWRGGNLGLSNGANINFINNTNTGENILCMISFTSITPNGTGNVINFDNQGGSAIDAVSRFIDFMGVAGDVAEMSKSTFRLTNSMGNFSPKIYTPKLNRPYGWKGGFGISTYSISKVGESVSFGSSVITTSNAYYDIATGQQQPITYVDAGVGTAGIMSTVATYYAGVQTPFVGEFVAVYGTLRLAWDISYSLGANWGPIGAYYGTNKWSGK